MIDLNEKRQDIIAVATELFEKFVNMPKDVRPDDKERTGIQVLAWEPGTINLVLASVKEPSEAARFFAAEKAVRSLNKACFSSQNYADSDCLEYPGSITFVELFDAQVIIVSTSGLKAEEDVAISAGIIAAITGKSFVDVCNSIDSNDGDLPDWYKAEDKSYFQFLFE